MSEEKSEERITPSGSTPVTRRRGNGGLFLFLLLLVAAVAAGGYYGWQLLRTVKLEDQQQEQALQQMRDTLDQHLQGHEKQSETARTRLDELEGRLAAQQSRLQQLRAGGQTDWLLNEAEALASLAQQRLLLTGDIAASRRLLGAADEVLKRVDLPEAISARKALATDLEKLRGADQVDIAGLVLRLDALREQVAGLTVPAAKRADADAGQVVPREQVDSWQGWLAKLPITVRRHDETLPLPLDKQQASLLRLYLNSDLQKAQLAALQARPQVYTGALANARDTLDTWFAGGERVAQLDSGLQALQQASLEQALPEIGDGLAAIRALIHRRGDRG